MYTYFYVMCDFVIISTFIYLYLFYHILFYLIPPAKSFAIVSACFGLEFESRMGMDQN
jgi:hypothetical protein